MKGKMAVARNDAENLRILEELKPEFERLKTERIRTDDAIERHAAEFETAKARALEVLKTADEAEIRTMISDLRDRNTQAVDDFRASLQDVKKRLAELEQAPA